MEDHHVQWENSRIMVAILIYPEGIEDLNDPRSLSSHSMGIHHSKGRKRGHEIRGTNSVSVTPVITSSPISAGTSEMKTLSLAELRWYQDVVDLGHDLHGSLCKKIHLYIYTHISYIYTIYIYIYTSATPSFLALHDARVFWGPQAKTKTMSSLWVHNF